MERNYDEVISEMLIQLTIKRMVKAESRLEGSENRMELFDKKLEQSIENQKEFSVMQAQMNKYFLDYIKNSIQK